MKTGIVNSGMTGIKDNIGNPEMLEKLFRSNQRAFREEFESIYPSIESTEAAKFWRQRLDYDNVPEKGRSFPVSEIITLIGVCALTAFLIRIPALFPSLFPDEVFYQKNAAIIVFLGLVLYTVIINRITDLKKLATVSAAFLVSVLYINLLPSKEPGDAVILVYIHMPLLMWFIYGIVFTDFELKNHERRIDFIRHNGDIAIVFALIAAAGGFLTMITIGLFDSIGLNIEEWYAENIIVAGAVSAPVVAAYLIGKFPSLVSRIAPLIAAIFSPLVLVTLVVFLITMAVTGKDPYNDRDFLLVFNVLLLGVMGIIIFSVSGTAVIKNQKINAMVLFILSIVTIIIDLIALSAIFYRLGEYGLTPNRLAVLVSNILVLINLIMIMNDLFRVNFRNKEFDTVGETISKYLPVYLVWIIIVVFGFPLFFGLN
jgi:hypothetical protein